MSRFQLAAAVRASSATEQSRIASQPTVGDPLPRPVGETLGRGDPADHGRGHAARLEDRRQRANHQLTHAVARERPVTVGELGGRRDDVRRVADRYLEALAVNGIEEAAVPELDVADAVEGRVEGSEGQSAFVDIGRNDGLRVPREEQRLDPEPGSQVQCATDVAADGEVRECRARSVHPGDVVGTGARIRPVRYEQEVVVGHDPYEPAHLVARCADEPRLDQRVDVTELPLRRREVDRLSEEKEPDEQRQCVLSLSEAPTVDVCIALVEQPERAAFRRLLAVEGVRDRGRVVPGRCEEPADAGSAGHVRRRRPHRQGSRCHALAFFLTSQLPVTAAPSDPSSFCGE